MNNITRIKILANFMKYICAFVSIVFLYLSPGHLSAKELVVDGTGAVPDLVCSMGRTPIKSNSSGSHEQDEPPAADDLPESFLLNNQSLPKPIPIEIQKHGSILSVGIWGDSHSAANFFSDELVATLGLSKNQYRPTFIPPSFGRGGVRLPIKKYCKSDGWSYLLAYTSKLSSAQFSPSLISLTSNISGSNLAVDFRFSDNRPALESLTILLRPSSDDISINLTVDSLTFDNVNIPAGDDRIILKASSPFSIVKLMLQSGSLTIEGFLPTYTTEPSLFLDTFGIPGATAKGWKNIDPIYMKKKLPPQQYDLAILQYGTNEGADRNFDPISYKESLSLSLGKFKSVFPSTECVLIGPTDRGVLIKRIKINERKKNKTNKIKLAKQAKSINYVDLLKYSSVHQNISEIQASVASEFGCKFWNWQNAMGGKGGSYGWFHKNPRLMANDLIHLTIPGYQESARTFVESVNLKKLFRE